MAKPAKNQLTLIVVLIVAAVGVGIMWYMQSIRNAQTESADSLRSKGQPNAPIQIVEYIDFQCPACAWGAKYLNEFIKANPGMVHLKMRYFPLGEAHKHAMMASRYAECALRQKKFWEFHDQLINQQDNWKNLQDVYDAFDILAQNAGLDVAALKTCIRDESVEQEIARHKDEGKGKGIQSTPTYFINGEMVVGGKALQEKLEKLLPTVSK